MAKTEKTIELEKKIWEVTMKMGVFGCYEVTIGNIGNERVDFLTFDTKGTWRCYEIKVSKADFHSSAKVTFVGHYNYYVMPRELYDEVKNEIPNHVGVYCGTALVKKAKKQKLGVDEQVLKNSMIRSLSRENEKFIKTMDDKYINRLKNRITNTEKEVREQRNKATRYSNAIYEICDKYNLDHREVRKLIRD